MLGDTHQKDMARHDIFGNWNTDYVYRSEDGESGMNSDEILNKCTIH